MSGNVDVSGQLDRGWWRIAGVFGLVAAAATVGAAGEGSAGPALRWGIGASAVAATELWYLRRHLRRNHPVDRPGELYKTLGIANLLTVTRGGAFAAVAGFALVEPARALAWLPAVCYGIGVALDGLDGIVARTVDRTTVLGRKLDLAFDTLGFFLAPVVGVLWGRLPVWYLSLAVARYAFKFACWGRSIRGLPVGTLPESPLRRRLAGLQMVFLTVALAPLLPADTVYSVAPVALLPSLLVFGRDYLAVTGRWR